jgi:molybdenum cofactor cytidylyltransferase
MIAAIVPAAGHSLRMGKPKLTLSIGGSTVIARVVQALKEGGVSIVVVVPPPADAPGAASLIQEAASAGAAVVEPLVRPVDMRSSFELGLTHLEQIGPAPSFVLLTPADSPGVTSRLVAEVIARAKIATGSIVIPVHDGKRGHPIALPWELAQQVRTLPGGVGVNSLIALHASLVVEHPVTDPGAVADLDTPEDYVRWLEGTASTGTETEAKP